MKHGLCVLLIGVAQVAIAASGILPFPWLFLWSGLAWIAAAVSYSGVGPRVVFGKGVDGRLGLVNTALMLPYLLPSWGLWHLQRLTSREDVCNEIVDGVWLGRRCSGRRLPANIASVVDMTCEFAERREVVNGRRYLSVPTPDGHVPKLRQLSEAVEEAAMSTGPLYVHCAVGHGRSAMFVAALLLRRGLAADVDEAEAIIKVRRPLVQVNQSQRRLLAAYAATAGARADSRG